MQSASDQPPVLLQRDGPVVRLTINRPSAGNRLDNATTRALLAHVETLAADHGTRAVILTAAGETFSAGADLSVPAGRSSRCGRHVAPVGAPPYGCYRCAAAANARCHQRSGHRRRLRTGTGHRSAPAGARRPDRPTPSTSGDDPGLGRHPTAGAPGWAERGEGADLYRSPRRSRGGAAPRPRERRPSRLRAFGRRAGAGPAAWPRCLPEPLPAQRRPSTRGWTGTSLRATRSKWPSSSACPADSHLLLDLRGDCMIYIVI